MPISIRITHDSADADKALKVMAIPPQGPPVISHIQPGESAVFEVADCNELHLCEWDAVPKAEA